MIKLKQRSIWSINNPVAKHNHRQQEISVSERGGLLMTSAVALQGRTNELLIAILW
jgi:hypothetical protein